MSDIADDGEELLRLADELYPDDVDLVEDALAAEIGLRRHPGTPQDAWRRIRVQGIDRRGFLTTTCRKASGPEQGGSEGIER